ncbi:hypothetical protein SAMN05421780_10111 [Flexibacter flexilis DSM 6793]|uniref:Glycosyltransferase RgtA/B/C/D-like domain-containing protein n=2 Tax=Flexibacter flexilis TaxID=998 RepID=A0A1I1DBZ3_9BACT|nr:hypothetical protein SAMN05421780_10111 [Flexibacter flexilis DSM 6793]
MGFGLWLIYVQPLPDLGLPTFDATYNAHIIKQITDGNWANLYNHASPTFFVLFAPLYWLWPKFVFLQAFNAGIMVAAVVAWAIFWTHWSKWQAWQIGAFVGAVGLSPVLVHNARGFSIEALSLVCVAVVLHYFLVSIRQASGYWKAAFWASVGLTINYKLLLVWGIFLFIFFIQKEKQITVKQILSILIAASFPILAAMCLGYAVGLKFWLYPAVLYHVLLRPEANAAGVSLALGHDWIFYFKYFWQFDNLITLLFILAGIFTFFFHKNRWAKLRNADVESIVLLIIVLYFTEICLLPKAPRILLPLCTLSVGFGLSKIQNLFSKKLVLKYATGLLCVSWSAVATWQNIRPYTHSNYAKAADILPKNTKNELVSTVGINAFQYLPEANIHFAFEDSAAQHYEYLLLDDYRFLANIPTAQRFNTKQYTLLGQWPEPSLGSAILWLEHCEFSGLNFQQTLHLRDSICSKPFQVQLWKKKKI